MKKHIIYSLLLLAVTCSLVSYDLPKGWFKAGSDPEKYDMGVEMGMGMNSKYAATIKSLEHKKIHGFGTLMQDCSPEKYLGKRVRMTGYMRTQDVKRWAGFWFRVDQAGSKKPLAFDNMQRRAATGTSEYTRYEIVLDVPQNASNLAYGALLAGPGQIWFDDINFEIVDKNIPTTGY